MSSKTYRAYVEDCERVVDSRRVLSGRDDIEDGKEETPASNCEQGPVRMIGRRQRPLSCLYFSGAQTLWKGQRTATCWQPLRAFVRG